MEPGEMIRRTLKQEGKTQEWLAAELGVSQSSVSQYLRNPTWKTLARIYEVLPVPELQPLFSKETDEEMEIVGVKLPKEAAHEVERESREDPEFRQMVAEFLRLTASLPPESKNDVQLLLTLIRKLAGRDVRSDHN